MNRREVPKGSTRWSKAFFKAEEATWPAKPPRPAPHTGLRAGDRVEFDLGEGVDGPPYAMNVRPIDSDD